MTIINRDSIKAVIQNSKATRVEVNEACLALNLNPSDYSNIPKAKAKLTETINRLDVVDSVAPNFGLFDVVKTAVIVDTLGELMVAALDEGTNQMACRQLAKAAGLEVAGIIKHGLFKAAERTLKALGSDDVDVQRETFDALEARRATYAAMAHNAVPSAKPLFESGEAPASVGSGWTIQPYSMTPEEFGAQMIARAEGLVANDYGAMLKAIQKEHTQVLISPTGEKFRLGRGIHEVKSLARELMRNRDARRDARILLGQNGRVVSYGAAVPPPSVVAVRESISLAAAREAIKAHPHDLHKIAEATKTNEANLAGALAEALEIVVG